MDTGDEDRIPLNMDSHLGCSLGDIGCGTFCDLAIDIWRTYRARRGDGGSLETRRREGSVTYGGEAIFLQIHGGYGEWYRASVGFKGGHALF